MTETDAEMKEIFETPTPTYIVHNRRGLPEVMRDLYKAIQVKDNPYRWFDRGGSIVIWAKGQLTTMDKNRTISFVAEAADWKRESYEKNETGELTRKLTPSFPPDLVFNSIMGGNIDLPIVRGIVRGPIFIDGKLVVERGYHPSGWIYDPPEGFDMPTVSESPTDAEISEARYWIEVECLGDFPFADVADKANAIAFILAPFVKSMISGAIPPFLIDAPAEGTGKSLLAQLQSVIACGTSSLNGMPEAESDAEFRKQITSTLMRAPELVCLDNCNRAMSSGALASLWTSRQWSDRLLGYTKSVSLSNDAIWCITANNFHSSKEIARRLILISLDSGLERPDERTEFRHPELLQWAMENRGKLVHSACTLISAWIAKGKPGCEVVMGSFEQFVSCIGGILKAAAVEGFLRNRDRIFSEVHTASDDWGTFVKVWHAKFGSEKVTVSDLHSLATEENLLNDLFDRCKKSTPRAEMTMLGCYLGKKIKSVSGGLRLGKLKDATDRTYYWLESQSKPSNEASKSNIKASKSPTLADITGGEIPFDVPYQLHKATNGSERVSFRLPSDLRGKLNANVASSIIDCDGELTYVLWA